MNKLSPEQRAKVLQLLCEGMAIRAVSRVTGAGKNTIMRLLADAGVACAAYQDRVLRHLPCQRVQLDEIWSFVHCKHANLPTAKRAPMDAGDVWTWTALCADSKLLVSFLVGDRTIRSARQFVDDLAERLASRIQITTDGHIPYLRAVGEAFGPDIDYAVLQKIYASERVGPARYSPPVCTGAKKQVILGNPDPKHVNTSYVERHNLTMRMHMRRFTRLTNGHSKKIDNHACAVALHAMFYNFTRKQAALKMTPAMAAGVTKRVWTMLDVVEMIDAWEARENRRVA